MENSEQKAKTAETLLEIRNLKTYFKINGSIVKAVDNVSLKIINGEILGLIGETGCGKSVLGLSILRLLPENAKIEGNLLFRGKEILSLSKAEMRKLRGKEIVLIPQNPSTSLNPLMQIGCQVLEAVIRHHNLKKSEAVSKVLDLFSKLKLQEPPRKFRDFPHQLSGGMKQRVLMAMGVACNPKLIIVDEPTKGLDAVLRIEVVRMLKETASAAGTSMLLITHDFSVAAALAHRIAVMYAGEIVEMGKTAAVLRNPRHPYTAGLLNSLPGKGFNPIPGSSPSIISLPEGCRFHPRCSRANMKCTASHPELVKLNDDHFVRCFNVCF
ncbi:MAG TPA: dipeptide ABC transporter ATP-binding protein DppD [Peptococcaceae bacterium]|nr:dipeptide ABC transporter ATP-binding protein DppD [Peptococcaceae bacterium]